MRLLILLGFWRDLLAARRAARDFWAGHQRPSLQHLRIPKGRA